MQDVADAPVVQVAHILSQATQFAPKGLGLPVLQATQLPEDSKYVPVVASGALIRFCTSTITTSASTVEA